MSGTIFQLRDTTYTADRCDPLIRAVKKGQIHLQTLARAGYPGKPLQKGELPGVLSVGFWDAAVRQEWGLDFHCNEGIELTFLETGRMPFKVHDKLYTLRPGKMTITRPWQPHALGNPTIEPGRLHWLILDVGVRRPHQPWRWPSWFVLTQSDLQKLTRLLRENETSVWNADASMQSIFRQIGQFIQAPRTSLRISRLTVLINELFLLLFEILDRKKIILEPNLTTTQRTVEMFLRELDNPSLLQQEWTIQKMARQCHLGVTHFTRLCRKLTNLTPGQYLNYQRIEMAAELLCRQPHRTITEIAFECGFNSSQYFATLFGHIKGASPNQFRKAKR
jgi:AraC-like DNA-binding protein